MTNNNNFYLYSTFQATSTKCFPEKQSQIEKQQNTITHKKATTA